MGNQRHENSEHGIGNIKPSGWFGRLCSVRLQRTPAGASISRLPAPNINFGLTRHATAGTGQTALLGTLGILTGVSSSFWFAVN
jgi:hypothetical protein